MFKYFVRLIAINNFMTAVREIIPQFSVIVINY
jgi:hypothetical protein